MDIKLLLLKSLSFKKPINGSYRIYFGKVCFVIKYEINGKILGIKSIKYKRKRKTWAERIKNSYGAYQIQCRRNKNKLDAITRTLEDKEIQTNDVLKHLNGTQTEESKLWPEIKEASIQKFSVQKQTKEVQTETLKNSPNIKELVLVNSRSQQTIASVRYIRYTTSNKTVKSCQTDLNTECKGIQCKRATQVKAINTDFNTRDSFTQSQNVFLGMESPQEAANLLTIPIKDFEVFIYMLNEIGDNVISQNQLLNNNTEVMKQIIKINMMKNSTFLNVYCRSISIQTDQLASIEKKNNFSQTEAKCTKPRKLLLFKGKNSQRNK